MYKIISSANKDILCSSLLIFSPLISLLSRIHDANNSTTITNNELDKGHPCLVPLLNTKKSDEVPFVITAALGLL